MWFKSEMSKLLAVYLLMMLSRCKAISTASFNSQIRENYVPEDNINITAIKTLQKQGGLGRYASFAPDHKSIKFKEVPDSELSSSHSRGLLHHEHTGYGFTDYDDPHIGHGYEHQPHDLGHHYFDHHDGHHLGPSHHHGYGHHHKHYDHGLATKALIWPIAGIALLGAAAALVTNPVLLQLGVISGKRKRRQTEEVEFARNSIKKWTNQDVVTDTPVNTKRIDIPYKANRRILRKSDLANNLLTKSSKPTYDYKLTESSNDDNRFIPIPLKFKNV